MKKLLSLLLLSSFVTFLFLYSTALMSPILADDTNDITAQLQAKEAEIQKLEGQLIDARKQEKSLKSQLDLIDGQTKVTTLKIEETNLRIEKLKREINNLATRIDRISITLDSLSELLLGRIVQTYKYSNSISTFDLIFSSRGITELIERLKYIQVAQTYDKKKLYELQATKLAYNDQKQDKQTRQSEAEKLNKDLENYKKQLEEQKRQKDELLKITKNNEERFQALITQLRADTESLARALAGGGVSLGEHNKGDRIALVGSSGCSTGPHLHFEVITPARIENGKIVDTGDGRAIGWGMNHRVDPKPYIDSGQFSKPVAEYTGNDNCSRGGQCLNGDISTRFGQTYYVFSNSGTQHGGLDIADYFGAPIYAVEKGTVYAFQDSQSCWLSGTPGKGVAIDHHNGMVTLYWHIP